MDTSIETIDGVTVIRLNGALDARSVNGFRDQISTLIKAGAIRFIVDGAQLTFRGLPTPDLFTGGYNFHGKLEFNSRRGLEKTTEMLVHLVQVVATSGRLSASS